MLDPAGLSRAYISVPQVGGAIKHSRPDVVATSSVKASNVKAYYRVPHIFGQSENSPINEPLLQQRCRIVTNALYRVNVDGVRTFRS